jgi:CubicO group peptidase (beta-lactamase class C family)
MRIPAPTVSRAALLFMAIALIARTPQAGAGQLSGEGSGDDPPTEAARLRREVNIQNWDDGGPVSHFAFLHTSEVFPTAVIPRAGPLTALEDAPNPAVGSYVVSGGDDRRLTLDQYIAEGHGIDGFIVLHHGRVAYEKYPRMRAQDKHLLMSVTKVFIGTAVGLLEDRGKVDIQRGIGEYVRGLRGTAWEKVTVRDVLEMSSGMEGAGESYTDPTNKHYQYEASLGWLPTTPEMPESVKEGETLRYLASLKHIRPPGEAWAYTSVNTAILAWLLEETTGQSTAEVLSDLLWQPMRAEADALMAVNSKGVAVAHGGMATTLRDLARFGLLFTPSWSKTSQTRVITETFLRRITHDGRPTLVKDWFFGPRPDWLDHVAYQWDAITKSGRLFKGGFGGQRLCIDPGKDVVIAHFGTNETIDDVGPLLDLGDLIDHVF